MTSRRSATRSPAARAPTSSTRSWSIGSGSTPAAALVTQESARQRIPMCRAASTSGTVDIPTRSAPSARIIRISAGVSNAGPSQAAYTPSPSASPSLSAASCASLRYSGSYASDMSGKRGPSVSSFGPTSGEEPWRLRWSAIATRRPGSSEGSIPPHAFVSTRLEIPSRPRTRTPKTTAAGGCPS